MSAVMNNIPQIIWSQTGPIIPSDSAILTGVQANWQQALGSNLNLALNTPQGQLMQAETAAISNCYALVGLLIAGMDPDMNSGFMQDVIARIYFLNRNPGTPTVASCVVSGQLGGQIVAGQPIASDGQGNLYAPQTSTSIPVSGNVTVTFACTVNGPISCGAGALKLNQAVSGIDSITDPDAGVPGSNVEQRAALEYRREQSVASNSNGPADAVYGAVIDLPGVTDAYVIENDTDDPETIGSTNFTLTPHSIYVGVIGGEPSDIGNAIRTKKGPGCDTNGNSTVTVTDPNYSYPQPSYTYKYNDNAENPSTYNLTVNIVNSSALPGTIVADVQAAVAAQFNGSNANAQRVRIGSLLLASSFVGPVATCEGPSVPVSVLSIGIGSTFAGTGTVENGSTTLTIATVATGSVSNGTPVAGTGVASGAYIVRQLSGTTGGVGTYQMSVVATATEGSPVSIAGAATGTSALIGIDQAPVLGAVVVNLI